MNSANAIPPRSMNTIATIAAGTATRMRESRSERRRSRWRGGGRRGGGRRAGRRERGGCPREREEGGPDRRADGTLTASEAATAGREFFQALLERLAREVGPELIAEDQLGVCPLPQQVV